jgi:hypothetical protein
LSALCTCRAYSTNNDGSFLNRVSLRQFILLIGQNSMVTIDEQKAQFIDHDILETLDDFIAAAPDSNITIEIIELYGK